MKVCLIEPPKFVSLTNFVSTISMPPIGLAYIASAVRESGHDVSVVYAPGLALTLPPQSSPNVKLIKTIW